MTDLKGIAIATATAKAQQIMNVTQEQWDVMAPDLQDVALQSAVAALRALPSLSDPGLPRAG